MASYAIRYALSIHEHYMLHIVIGDGFIHFRAMLSTQKHGRTGIPQKKKPAERSYGQEGEHHHKREKGSDKETYGIN
jgi:hypothetical protein